MKRSTYLKNAIWAGVLLSVVLAAAWSLRPQPVAVTSARVTRDALTATVTAEGRTRVKDLYVVAAPVDGQLERIALQPGDAAHTNEVIATIRPVASRPLDPRTRAEASAAAAAAKAALARAEATQEEARVALEHADSQLATTRKLAEHDSIPADELTHRGHESEMRRRALDAAVAAAAEARASLARAEAVLGTAADTGQAISVRAPIAGRILRVLRESAGPIASGTPLLEVGDVARLQIDADLLSSDAAEVRVGATATVTGWGGAQPLRARVRRIDPAAFTKVSALGLEEQRVHVILDLTNPPPPGLGHDYRVDVSIVVWEGRNVLRVPSTALFRSGERWTVFTIHEGRARLSPVEIGRSDGSFTAITRGISDGEVVIVQPSDQIRDGSLVRADARQ